MCLLGFYLKIFLTLFLDLKKSKKKKVFNQSIVNGERHKEVKKVERSEYLAEKVEEVKNQVKI